MTWTPGPHNSPPPDRPTGRDGTDRDAAGDRDDALARLANDARTDDRVAERRRERWLRRQAAESSTFGGVLTNLAERRSVVRVRVSTGRAHRGRITAIGADVVVLETGEITPTVIALHHVTAVDADPGTAVDGDRLVPAEGPLLRHVLAGLADDEPVVRVTAADGAPLIGVLRWVGEDVAALTVGPDDRGTGAPTATWAYVRLSSMVDVSPNGSG